jgi:uncharacterized membrane protein YeaQ/YmgE (transglycosylase-associated protein family)
MEIILWIICGASIGLGLSMAMMLDTDGALLNTLIGAVGAAIWAAG